MSKPSIETLETIAIENQLRVIADEIRGEPNVSRHGVLYERATELNNRYYHITGTLYDFQAQIGGQQFTD